ncbi:pseudouridine synthase [Radiomyces spectabilis]|uniref:pseudouridine synthase n=1 Tax=Radiomyces spectabilis TaxID=64574 RepID=UPI002220A110|nr:pseudouridine synthase [Radiomyces spectabilis]KAI8365924.1 pseudouridine synthase [Radiomyces spectabilis]
MGGIWSREQSDEQPGVVPDETPVNGNKRAIDEEPTTTAEQTVKRKKTTKERRAHFRNNNSWKATEEAKKNDAPAVSTPRLAKRKVALLIGFSGTGFQGMQINPGVRTIESVLFEAMCKAGVISQANSEDPKKVQWMRAARTDKGVHAAGNVVSLKMGIPEDESDVVPRINSFLPEQIRVWGYVPTIRSFHAKTGCDSRVYEYLLPTYAFMPPSPKELKEAPTSETDLKLMGNSSDVIRYISRSTDEEMAKKEAYRIDTNDLTKFREALKMFEGTHNFHNYTIGRGYNDRSSNRYIMSINVGDPIYINDTEWLSVKLHGQSFMLHQIRKMISMALLVVRTKTPLSLIERSFGSERINIPKAPALGLLLERPVFDAYNRRAVSKKDNKFRDAIDFDKYKDTIDAFKQEWIYSKIFAAEKEERGFDTFLLSVDSHFGPDYKYLNAEGTIPEEAIITTKYTVKKDKSTVKTNEEQDELEQDAEEEDA